MEDDKREQRRKYQRQYYIANKEKALKRSKARYYANREEIREQAKRRYERGDFRAFILDRARQRARKFGIEFSITVEDIVIPEFCPAIGIRLKRNKKAGGKDSPSLDRIDPAKGYVPGNVQVISMKANALKSNLTPDEIRNFAKWILDGAYE